VWAASQDSALLTLQEITFSLHDHLQLPRDVYNCSLLDFGMKTFFIFQRSHQITYFELRKETTYDYSKEALPLDMHLSQYKLYFVTKNQKGTFDIIQIDFSKKDLNETVIGTDYNEIIASACLAEGNNSKIVTLNSLREIKVYQTKEITHTYFANISPESYDFSIPSSLSSVLFQPKGLECGL